jgi:hypothetical protein
MVSPKAGKLRANERRLGSGFAPGIDVIGPTTHVEPTFQFDLPPALLSNTGLSSENVKARFIKG